MPYPPFLSCSLLIARRLDTELEGRSYKLVVSVAVRFPHRSGRRGVLEVSPSGDDVVDEMGPL